MPQITVEQIVHQRALQRLKLYPTKANKLKALSAQEQCIKQQGACNCKLPEEAEECQSEKLSSGGLFKRGKKLFGL